MGSGFSLQSYEDNTHKVHFSGKLGNETLTFEIVKALGSGSFGDVYKVKDIDTKNCYALKVIPDIQKENLPKAQKEAKVLEKIDHPNVVKHVGSFEQRTGSTYTLCIVMELVEGKNKNLLEELRSLTKKPEVSWVMCLFIQLLDTICYLHEPPNPVAHRDLKPENILILVEDEKPKVKVADFGLAVELPRASATLPSRGGTRAFMAPEVHDAQRATSKVDVWALGLILFQSLTLNSEFYKYPLGWKSYITSKPRALESIEDVGLRCLIETMLTEDPNTRPSSQELCKNDILCGWDHLLSDQPPPEIKNRSGRFLSAYVSILRTERSELLQRAFNHIQHFLQTQETQIAATARFHFLLLQIVPNLCHLIETRSKLNHASLVSLIFQEGMKKRSPQPIKDKKPETKNSDHDTIGINLLQLFLERESVRIITANHIHGNNSLRAMIEKYKFPHPRMNYILIELCKVPFICRELQEYFALETILYSQLQDRNLCEYAMDVFPFLRFHNNQRALSLFLEVLSVSCDTLILSRVCQLIKNAEKANLLISPRNVHLWTSRFTQLLGLNSKLPGYYFSSLVHLILPMKKILHIVTNLQVCTKNIFLVDPIQQYTSGKQCISCANRCKSTTKYAISEKFLVCACNQEICSSAVDFPVPRITEDTNRNMILVGQEYHRVPNLYVAEDDDSQIIANIDDSESLNPFYFIAGANGRIVDNPNIEIQLYTETKVLRAPKRKNGGIVAVGLTLSLQIPNIPRTLLGWERKEIAYHSDGKLFISNRNGAAFAPSFGYGDVVGCGITGNRKIFFTLNGTFVGFVSSVDFPLQVNSRALSVVGVLGRAASISIAFREFMYSPSSKIQPCTINSEAVEALFPQNLNFEFIDLLCQCASQEVVSILIKSLKIVDIETYNRLIASRPALELFSCSSLMNHILELAVISKTSTKDIPLIVAREIMPRKEEKNFNEKKQQKQIFSTSDVENNYYLNDNSIVQNIVKESSYYCSGVSEDPGTLLIDSQYSEYEQDHPVVTHGTTDAILSDSSIELGTYPLDTKENCVGKSKSEIKQNEKQNEVKKEKETEEHCEVIAVSESLTVWSFCVITNEFKPFSIIGEISVDRLIAATRMTNSIEKTSKIELSYFCDEKQISIHSNRDVVDWYHYYSAKDDLFHLSYSYLFSQKLS